MSELVFFYPNLLKKFSVKHSEVELFCLVTHINACLPTEVE